MTLLFCFYLISEQDYPWIENIKTAVLYASKKSNTKTNKKNRAAHTSTTCGSNSSGIKFMQHIHFNCDTSVEHVCKLSVLGKQIVKRD